MTDTEVNSAFHHSGVGELSTDLSVSVVVIETVVIAVGGVKLVVHHGIIREDAADNTEVKLDVPLGTDSIRGLHGSMLLSLSCQSINQSKHICVAPYVASESEAHSGRTRLSVHVYNRQCQTVQFIALRSSADLQLYDSEFHIGALTLNDFADSASAIRGTVSSNLSDDRNVHAGR